MCRVLIWRPQSCRMKLQLSQRLDVASLWSQSTKHQIAGALRETHGSTELGDPGKMSLNLRIRRCLHRRQVREKVSLVLLSSPWTESSFICCMGFRPDYLICKKLGRFRQMRQTRNAQTRLSWRLTILSEEQWEAAEWFCAGGDMPWFDWHFEKINLLLPGSRKCKFPSSHEGSSCSLLGHLDMESFDIATAFGACTHPPSTPIGNLLSLQMRKQFLSVFYLCSLLNCDWSQAPDLWKPQRRKWFPW